MSSACVAKRAISFALTARSVARESSFAFCALTVGYIIYISKYFGSVQIFAIFSGSLHLPSDDDDDDADDDNLQRSSAAFCAAWSSPVHALIRCADPLDNGQLTCCWLRCDVVRPSAARSFAQHADSYHEFTTQTEDGKWSIE